MTKLLLFLLMGVLITGCATAYQREGFSGGYTETQLGRNIFQVSFRGNGYTGSERASDFALLRSAEVAVENGFRYFMILESGNDSSLSAYSTPRQSYTTVNSYGYGSTTTHGGQTYVIRKPSTTNTIVCFDDWQAMDGLLLEAEFVMKSLRHKYGITN